MKTNILLTLSFIIVSSCTTNPFTGQKHVDIFGNSEIFANSFQSYTSFLNENKVIANTTDANRVKTVGMNIRKAVETYLKSVGQENYLNGYSWEYNLVEDPSVNAWCMPGGKIVFYTGIIPVCQNDAGIATVMGHEIAHALLNHGKRRMQTAYGIALGGAVLEIATEKKSSETQKAIAMAYAGGAQFGVLLPFSRNHETEADELGLRLMAIAGYNPENAISFWKRMATQNGGNEPAEWMSTHPSNATRIQNIQKMIPTAKSEATKFGVVFR